MFFIVEAQLFPGGAQGGWLAVEVEESKILRVAPSAGCIDGCSPHAGVFKSCAKAFDRPAERRGLIDEQQRLVGDERARVGVQLGEVGAQNQRRARYAPQGEFGFLFVRR